MSEDGQPDEQKEWEDLEGEDLPEVKERWCFKFKWYHYPLFPLFLYWTMRAYLRGNIPK